MDIAQIVNGYIYHTEYDVIDHISHECFQNSGDNALGIIRGLANATELYNTEVRLTRQLCKQPHFINSTNLGTSRGKRCLL